MFLLRKKLQAILPFCPNRANEGHYNNMSIWSSTVLNKPYATANVK